MFSLAALIAVTIAPASATVEQDPATKPESTTTTDPTETTTAPADTERTDDTKSDAAMISGVLSFQDGQPAVAVRVSLFTAKPDRSPDAFLRPAFTDSDGRFSFGELAADCYIIEAEAPVGASFVDGTERHQVHSCVDPGQTDDSAGADLITTEDGEPFRLNLLHVADHHSHIGPTFAESTNTSGPPVELGGFARVATKVAELKEAAGLQPTLTVHTGGALGGTPLFSVFRGAADATIMNAVCFDLFALGGRDLGYGPLATQTFLDFLGAANCRTEVLLSDESADLMLIRQQTPENSSLEVRRFGDHIVGFVTVPPPRSASGSQSTSAASHIDGAMDSEALIDATVRTQQQVDRLTEAGVGNIVLITEIGLANDLALASELTDIDAILGGGSNTLLGDFETVGIVADGAYPAKTTNRSGEPVCIGHAWNEAKVVGEMNLVFDDGGWLAGCDGTAHLLAAEGPTAVAPEEAVVTAVRTYELAMGSLANQPIGASRERFCLTGVPGRTVGLLCGPDVAGDSTIRTSDVQRLVADGIRSRIPSADMAIVNSGAAASGVPAGAITVERIYRLLPHDIKLAVVEMTGAEVVSTLEEGIEAAIGPEGAAAAYPHAMGLRWLAMLDEPFGGRATSVEVRPPGSVDWESIDPEAVYLVATTNAVAEGGHGYHSMVAINRDGRVTITAVDYAQAFIDYVEDDLLGIVSPFRSDRLN